MMLRGTLSRDHACSLTARLTSNVMLDLHSMNVAILVIALNQRSRLGIFTHLDFLPRLGWTVIEPHRSTHLLKFTKGAAQEQNCEQDE
jgi:hypothetical protein